jgi:magnesium transporter
MIRTLVLDCERKVFAELPASGEIKDACGNGSNVVWVDVNEPTDADFETVGRQFGFHPLSVEDSRNQHQRPKVEEYPGYYFIVLYQASLDDDGELELVEIDLFLGANYVVTVHNRPVRALETGERLWRNWTDVAGRGSGLLAYLIMDAVVDEYMPLIDRSTERMEAVEERIFGEFDPGSIEEIFHLKKTLLYLRRVVTPLRDVFNLLLRREQPILPRETQVYFQDVFDHLIRVADATDTMRDMLGSTMDAYLSISGNRMNMVMKRLTSISTILMSVTLVASVFGMNFVHMPELSWRFGYVGALAAMLTIGISLYVYFRVSRWL